MPKVNRIAERKNVLRDLIKASKPTIGTHVHSIWPGVVEVIGHSGAMDYVEFTGQYAPYDLFSLENLVRTLAVEIASFENATAVGPVNKLDNSLHFVFSSASLVILFLVILNKIPYFLISLLSLSNWVMFNP